MGFVAPFFLVGLAAVAVPIAIHLWGRSQAPRQPLATVVFLQRACRTVAPHRRLRQWLLLAARVAAVACVALVLAKPFVRMQRAVVQLGTAQNVVLLLDDSLSMRYRLDGESLFDRAKRQALDLVDSAAHGVRFALVLGAGQPNSEWTDDKARIRSALHAARASARAVDLGRAIRRAEQRVESASLESRVIVVFSDGSALLPDTKEPIQIVDVAKGTELPNRAITFVTLQPWHEGGPRGVQVLVGVSNFSTREAELPIALMLRDRLGAQGTVRVPGQSRTVHSFHAVLPEPGVFAGRVGLPEDALSEDDVRHFVVQGDRLLRVLMVNGDPRVVRHQDETFYLEAALNRAGQPQFDVTERMADAVGPAELQAVDVVVLCNVKRLGATANDLTRFVESGGGLLITMGENVDLAGLNQDLAALLPQPLASVWSTGSHREVDPSVARRLGRLEIGHPLLAPFSEMQGASLRSALFWKRVLLRPGVARDHGSVLAEFDDGAPALVEAKRGQGRVLLLVSTIDREWNDLPIRPGFLPLVQQAVRYLAGASMGEVAAPLLVGDTQRLVLGGQARRARVLRPDGKVIEVGVSKGNASFSDTEVVGTYQLEAQGEETRFLAVPELAFAVNVDPKESDLKKVTQPNQVRSVEKKALAQGQHREPLSGALAAALLGLLLAETFLGRRR